MENYDIFSKHYQLFCSHVTDFTPEIFKDSRDKLVTLTKNQFLELSTDVYDELLRRGENQSPFLPIETNYHKKRNQARQKLATLQHLRFKELCLDVAFEIKRRYPEIEVNEELKPSYNKHYLHNREGDHHTSKNNQNQPIQKNIENPNYNQNAKSLQKIAQNQDHIDSPMPPAQYSSQGGGSLTKFELQNNFGENTLNAQNRPPKDHQRVSSTSYGVNEGQHGQRLDRENQQKEQISEVFNQKEQEKPKTKPEYIPPIPYEIQNASKDRVLQKEIQILKQEAEDQRFNFDRLYEKLSTKLAQCEQSESNLMMELDEQQRVTADCRLESSNLLHEIKKLKHENNDLRLKRDETSNLLQEIKALKHENNGLRQDRDDYYSLLENLESKQASMEAEAQKDKSEIARLVYVNEKLNLECKELNATIDKLSLENNELKNSAQEKISVKEGNANIGLQPPTITQNNYNREIIDPIANNDFDDISPYTRSISFLIKEAQDQREPSPNVLVAMKSVVLSCKKITEDMEEKEKTLNLSTDEKSKTAMAKQNLSASLSKLMQKAKDCASSATEVTVGDLESSAEELSQYVYELVSIIENFSSPSDEKKDMVYAELNRSLSHKSSLRELKVFKTNKTFLEEQSEEVVVAIQNLLEDLRSPNTENLQKSIKEVGLIIDEILDISIEVIKGKNVDEDGLRVLRLLENANNNIWNDLEDLQNGGKNVKQGAATNAYEVAKVLIH